jgi:hypothetical protein
MLKMLFIFDDEPETKQYGVFGSAAELGGGVKGSLFEDEYRVNGFIMISMNIHLGSILCNHSNNNNNNNNNMGDLE